MPSRRPTYASPAEARAYDAGWRDGRSDKPVAASQLALCFPNAYYKGYWEGVADKEGHPEP